MASTEENNTMATENGDTAPIHANDNTPPAAITNQPASNGAPGPTQQQVGIQQQQGTASHPATQPNPNYNNTNNFGHNMGQAPQHQQWQTHPQQNQQWQPPQWQPPQPPLNHWQQPNQWQPSAAQPLAYPHHSGFYPNHQQFQGNYFHNQPPMPVQQSFHNQATVPAPTHQQPAGTGVRAADTGNNGGEAAVTDMGDDQSEVLTQADAPEEPQFFGAIANRLQAWEAQRKQPATEGPQVYEQLANYMNDQLDLGFVTQELDQSVKQFPVLKNVPLAMAPELEKTIYNSTKLTRDSSLKATEQSLKTIQKGIASSINALGPLAEVIMRQSQDNEELDAVSPILLDVIKFLSFSLNGLSKKRRDLLRPHIDAKYQKLGRKDEDFDPKFLFGGNLSERVREVKASNSLMKEVMKPDPKPQTQNQPKRYPQNSGGRNPNHNSGQRASNRSTPYNRNNNNNANNSSNTNSSNKQDFRKTGPSGSSGGYKRS